MRLSNSAKAGISIQIRQCVANHFVCVLITKLASIPLSVFNPLALLCCSSLLLYSSSIIRFVLCLSLHRSGLQTQQVAEFESGIFVNTKFKICLFKFQGFLDYFMCCFLATNRQAGRILKLNRSRD